MDTICGQKCNRFWDGEGYIYELFIENPVNHKGSLCYGVRDKILDEMRMTGGKSFIIKGKKFEVPNDIMLKDMRKEGFSNEMPSKFEGGKPMIFYYFKI